MRIGALVLAFASALTATNRLPAQQPITAKDLIGTWKIKNDAGGKKIGTLELRKNGEFQLTVGSTSYNTDSTTKWEFDSKDLKISFAPTSTNTVILMRGKVDHYLQEGKKVSFEFTLKEANRMPVKAGAMLILER
ncbi:MAG TPA: hypothetical protein VKS79_14530 [Gemmataceae bacterium]|nr:hypothetical protein [Gemmataceae bacterium]